MKIVFTTLATALLTTAVWAQTKQTDSLLQKEIALNEVFVSALRATKAMGVSFSNVKAEDFEARNLGQDLPILLQYLPGVVTTSDAELELDTPELG